MDNKDFILEMFRLGAEFDKCNDGIRCNLIINEAEKKLFEQFKDGRINKYAKHQYNRGVLGDTFVTFKDWIQ